MFSSYVSFPENVAVRFNELKQPVQTINRETIFYVAVAIFLVNNTIINAIVRLIQRVPTAQLLIPNQNVWAAYRPQVNTIFRNWVHALMAAINTILAMAMLVLSLLNRGDRTMQPHDYAWLLPGSTFLLIIVLVSLPIRLFMKPSDDE